MSEYSKYLSRKLLLSIVGILSVVILGLYGAEMEVIASVAAIVAAYNFGNAISNKKKPEPEEE